MSLYVSERKGRGIRSLAKNWPIELKGPGFLRENTVWFGSRGVPASSRDGERLLFLVPRDLPLGSYPVAIENAHGKTDTAGVAIRALESLRILAINNRSISFLNEETIHPGQEISIVGSGFLVENTVWFGTTSVLTQVSISGGAMLRVQVPASV